MLAFLALFAVIGGGAYAAKKLDGQKIKKDSIPLNRLEGELPEGPRGPAGPTGPTGATGAPGSALAYAKVSSAGVLDTGNSKNVSSANRVIEGYYCVQPTVAAENIIVSAADGITSKTASASFEDPFTSCPPNAVVVQTFENDGASAPDDAPFYLLLN